MTTLQFSDLGLTETLQKALVTQNYTTPTPIQAKAIPTLLEGGDLLGIAQTGTGKTAAFALPVLQKLSGDFDGKARPKAPRALILAPTRELAIQIGEAFRAYGAHTGLRHTVIYGGVKPRAQIQALARGVDILIATPGRLLDHMNQRNVRVDQISMLVLDEADRMLDMGFIRDVRKIVAATPKTRQSLLFSATMPSDIAKLAAEILNNPVRVEVTPVSTPVERIAQKVFHVSAATKRQLLHKLLDDAALSRVIVFTRTKHGANKVADQLERSGYSSDAIHGNKSQAARQKALKSFRAGETRVLVATDIAARGIDIDDISHVINYEMPVEPESYVHRIGRTARAGATGIALSFCDPSERSHLRAIERLTKQSIDIGDTTAYDIESTAQAESRDKPARNGSGRNGRPASAKPAGKKFQGAKNKSQPHKASGGAARDGQQNGEAKSGRPQNRRRFNRDTRGRQAA